MIKYIRDYNIYGKNSESYLYHYLISKYYVSNEKVIDLDEIFALKGKYNFLKSVESNLQFYTNHSDIVELCQK